MAESANSFAEFWPIYLRAHAQPGTRALHYIGTSVAIVLLLAFIATGDWRCLVGTPIAGYGFAWVTHFVIERNRPATFGHPLWSLLGDFYMLYLWMTAKLAPELVRAGER